MLIVVADILSFCCFIVVLAYRDSSCQLTSLIKFQVPLWQYPKTESNHHLYQTAGSSQKFLLLELFLVVTWQWWQLYSFGLRTKQTFFRYDDLPLEDLLFWTICLIFCKNHLRSLVWLIMLLSWQPHLSCSGDGVNGYFGCLFFCCCCLFSHYGLALHTRV